MKLTCPACGSRYDLDAAAGDADARRLTELLAVLPPQAGRALIPYLALFRPPKTGLRWSRMLALAQEITPQIQQAQVTTGGVTWAAPMELWAEAMQQLADRPATLTLPLKSHGYLQKIVAGLAEKRAAAAEREHEQRHRRGDGGRQSEATSVAEVISRQANDRSPPPDDWRERAIAERRRAIDDHQE